MPLLFLAKLAMTNPESSGSAGTIWQQSSDYVAGWGTTDGDPFTVWTRRFVYFPWRYDGSQSVAWVPRNPDRSATMPIGGG